MTIHRTGSFAVPNVCNTSPVTFKNSPVSNLYTVPPTKYTLCTAGRNNIGTITTAVPHSYSCVSNGPVYQSPHTVNTTPTAVAGHGNGLQQPIPTYSASCTQLLDPNTRHLAMTQLKQLPASPYAGEPHQYRGSLTALKQRISSLQLNALDEIDVMEAHTTGSARQVIQTFRTACCHDPKQALSVFYSILKVWW